MTVSLIKSNSEGVCKVTQRHIMSSDENIHRIKAHHQ